MSRCPERAAVIAAVISALGLILFATTPLTSPALFAMTFNIIVVVALLVLHWPTVETLGV